MDDYGDDLATAGTVAVGGSASGTLETAGDYDWFKVQLVAGVTYTISLQGLTLLDPYLQLGNSAGNLLAEDDDSGGYLDALLQYTAPTSGTYILAASGASDTETGTYTLAVTADDRPASTATTGTVAVGGSTTGRIELAGDADWFRVSLTAGVQYTINLRGAPSSGGTLSDTYFNGIYSSAGALISGTTNDDYGSSTDSRVLFTPTASGSYYLSAGGFGGATGSYTLSVAGASQADIAGSTATTATLGVGASLRSTIGAAGDVDWVKVTLTAGTTYVVELNRDGTAANPLADPNFLGIYSSAGALVPGTSNDDYGTSLDARVSFKPTASGTYYLAAASYGSGTGAYELKLSTTSTSSDSVGDTPATAAALAVGTPVTGTVNVARDVDWYKLTFTAGQTYQIELRGADSGAGSLADPRIAGVYNSAGTVIPGTGQDNAAGTLDALTYVRATASGTYYVAAAAADDGTGTFRLQVSAVPAQTDVLDNATTSATLAVGGTLSGMIDRAGDVDWFKVSLTAGTTYRIDEKGAGSDSGSLSDPFLVGVFDARGNALPGTSDDDSGTGTDALASFVAPASGTYYVAAGAYGGATGGYKLSLTGAGADTRAPTLLSTSPADNAGAVAVASNLTLQFSEDVKAGSGSIVITGGGGTRTISVTDTSQVQFNGSTLTLNPASNLAANTDYAVTFAAGVVKDLAGNSFAGLTSSTQFNFHTASSTTSTDTWTLLVYIAGDNNLEPYALTDLNEMESVTLPSSVNVVTLVDRSPGYSTGSGNWSDTRMGRIVHDTDTANVSTPLVSQGELNMGAQATLTNFINAAVAANPASHYGLVVWNHGGGLAGTAWDDSNANDNLTLTEMRAGVDASSVARFDFIGFDACLQGLVEQAWELRNLADVVVSSQELEPGDGWAYDDFLGRLAANPSMTAYDLAAAVVDSYGDFYAGTANTTLSAVRVSALASLRTAMDSFVNLALGAGGNTLAELRSAAGRAWSVDGAQHDYRDIGDFMSEVANFATSSNVRSAATSVLQALDAAVLAQAGTVPDATGLGAYLPLGSIDTSYTTQAYQFLQSSGWGNLVRWLNSDTRADTINGDELANDLRGFGGNDTINGYGGNDRLEGGTGTDTLAGGGGNDTYVIDSASDVIVEIAGGGSSDVVIEALASYTLPAEVEGGRINTGNAANLTGNGLDNVLRAGAGNNVLNGAGGADTADYTGAAAAVTVSLAITSAQATGASGSDTLVSIEKLTGSSYHDVLTGSSGNNTLTGAAGSDRLVGNGGADRFVLNSISGSDTITDFRSADDKIYVSMAGVKVGDGDTVIDGIVTQSGTGGYSSNAELVIITGNISGSLSTSAAAAKIGSASTAFAAGEKAIFVVDNGTATGVYLFTSAAADAAVSASELVLLATLSATPSLVGGDFLFGS